MLCLILLPAVPRGPSNGAFKLVKRTSFIQAKAVFMLLHQLYAVAYASGLHHHEYLYFCADVTLQLHRQTASWYLYAILLSFFATVPLFSTSLSVHFENNGDRLDRSQQLDGLSWNFEIYRHSCCTMDDSYWFLSSSNEPLNHCTRQRHVSIITLRMLANWF